MYEKITAGLAAITLLCVIGVITYNELTEERVTIVLELKTGEDPFKVLPQLPVRRITEIRSLDQAKNEYEVKVISRHKPFALLQMIMGSSGIKHATIKDQCDNFQSKLGP